MASDINWQAIKADYATGAYTLRKLGEKHGVSAQRIHYVAKADNWGKLGARDTEQLTQTAQRLKNNLTGVDNLEIARAFLDLADIRNAQKAVAGKLFDKINKTVDTIDSTQEINELASAFAKTSAPFKEQPQTTQNTIIQMPAPTWK